MIHNYMTVLLHYIDAIYRIIYALYILIYFYNDKLYILSLLSLYILQNI